MLACLAGCLVLTSHSYALETRGNPASSGAPNARLQKQPSPSTTFEGTCGSSDDLAERVEVCAKPLMDILQGTVEHWPRNDEDAMKLCDSFLGSERCIRDASRKCGKGIQKTIISTLALSIGRVRKRECARTKAAAITKTVMCIEKHQNLMQDWMSNVTGRLSAIEHQTQQPEKKINGVCCLVKEIEVELKGVLGPVCPDESAFITRLYRTVLEDVIDLVCRGSRCTDYLKGYKISKNSNFRGLIATLLRIVFSLDNN